MSDDQVRRGGDRRVSVGDERLRGEQGVAGERGAKGDHGQDGERGATGATSPYLGKAQTLALFAFVVLAFVLLAYRTEVNADRISRETGVQAQQFATFQRAFLQECEQRAAFDRKAVAFHGAESRAYLAVAEQERTNRFIDDALRAKRVANALAVVAAAKVAGAAQVQVPCAAFQAPMR